MQKKWLFFRWWEYDPHEWEILGIGVHIPGASDTFKVSKKCKYCGKWELEHFVEHEALIGMGYTPEEIRKFLHTRI